VEPARFYFALHDPQVVRELRVVAATFLNQALGVLASTLEICLHR
jgi:hypothetical protein